MNMTIMQLIDATDTREPCQVKACGMLVEEGRDACQGDCEKTLAAEGKPGLYIEVK